MNKKNRKKIPESIKERVRIRQNGRCVCCSRIGNRYHHVYPVSFCKNKLYNFSKNIILLCEEHHNKFHTSGDPDTFEAIYEYVWMLYYNEMPEKKEIIEIANEVVDILKKDMDDKTSNFYNK